MKKIICLIALSVLLVSCKEKPVEKPEKLIDKEIMEDILYDLAILQASVNYKTKIISNSIDVNTYIYEKYEIDSITLVQNQRFYASDVKAFKKMYKNISERIKTEEDLADSLSKKENKELKKPKLEEEVKPSLD